MMRATLAIAAIATATANSAFAAEKIETVDNCKDQKCVLICYTAGDDLRRVAQRIVITATQSGWSYALSNDNGANKISSIQTSETCEVKRRTQ